MHCTQVSVRPVPRQPPGQVAQAHLRPRPWLTSSSEPCNGLSPYLGQNPGSCYGLARPCYGLARPCRLSLFLCLARSRTLVFRHSAPARFFPSGPESSPSAWHVLPPPRPPEGLLVTFQFLPLFPPPCPTTPSTHNWVLLTLFPSQHLSQFVIVFKFFIY